MPVRFSSETDTFVTFKDVAVLMLRLTGHSGTIPSVIPAAQVGQALDALKAGVERVAAEEQVALRTHESASDANQDNDESEMISIRQRAFPLIRLMTGALKNGSDVRFVEE